MIFYLYHSSPCFSHFLFFYFYLLSVVPSLTQMSRPVFRSCAPGGNRRHSSHPLPHPPSHRHRLSYSEAQKRFRFPTRIRVSRFLSPCRWWRWRRRSGGRGWKQQRRRWRGGRGRGRGRGGWWWGGIGGEGTEEDPAKHHWDQNHRWMNDSFGFSLYFIILCKLQAKLYNITKFPSIRPAGHYTIYIYLIDKIKKNQLPSISNLLALLWPLYDLFKCVLSGA